MLLLLQLSFKDKLQIVGSVLNNRESFQLLLKFSKILKKFCRDRFQNKYVLWLDSIILKAFYSLNDTVILYLFYTNFFCYFSCGMWQRL